MYMSQLQLEQLLKDRRHSALITAQTLGNAERRRLAGGRRRRIRITIS